MFQDIKTIIVLVKGLEVIAKCCLNWISSHDDLCCCAEYLNVENQVESYNTCHQSDAQKQMVEYGFGRRFHAPNYSNVEVFFHIYIP